MIGRLWHGRAGRDGADAYEAHFRAEVLPALERVAGYRGAYLLRRDDAEGTEFAALTLFESLGAVRAFAGEQYEVAVVAPAARALLRDYERTARHYTVAVAPPEPV
jgi:heme-degrading monooxygenase HmoA